jgi:hypothetical protein
VKAKEGKSGFTAFTFTVNLSGPPLSVVTVDFATANGTATVADLDYIPLAGTVTFAVGVTAQLVTVQVVGDTKREADETFFVNLTNASPNAFTLDPQGLGTIVNDD